MPTYLISKGWQHRLKYLIYSETAEQAIEINCISCGAIIIAEVTWKG
ncbi:hypothetical protein [Methyloglobulus morosus]|nr:hypothetical protein [Methyloglobulus morosus]